MKSVKPGRGPSAMKGIGSIIAVIFGIFWTITAASSGTPGLFPLFGVLFIIMGIIQAVYNFKNATSKNRFSEFDITNDSEEKDLFQKMVDKSNIVNRLQNNNENEDKLNNMFCPYCGEKTQTGFLYCNKCGKKLP